MSHCHQHTECLENAVKQAETACAKRDLRFTDIRRKVLAIIWQSHKAISAAEVRRQLDDNMPPTTYRALEFLQKAGLIHHVATLNAYIGCPNPNHSQPSQLFICGDCHEVTEVQSEKMERQLADEAKRQSFKVRKPHLEILGQCAACQHADENHAHA